MSTTDERLSKLEQRVEKVEQLVETWKAKAEAFAAGPGKKLLDMLGIRL